MNSESTAVRLVFLRNVTLEAIGRPLSQLTNTQGLDVMLEWGGIDTAVQDAMGVELFSPPRELYVIHLSKLAGLNRLCEEFARLTDADLSADLDNYTRLIATLLAQIATKAPEASIAVHTLEAFAYPQKRFSTTSFTCQNQAIEAVNSDLQQQIAAYPRAFSVDNDLILRRLGYEQFYDWRYWYFARAPYTQQALQHFSQQYVHHITSRRGQYKKCLVLDCDNTLWGGIIGEDGAEGIQLGDAGKGAAYRDIQCYFSNLAANGVLLALCSKNNENDVWTVFEQHPAMVLTRTQISAHRINWQSKGDNILSLAHELNLGLESLVFIDDSDFETELIRQTLPAVTVLQLDHNNPSGFLLQLQKSGLFERDQILAEDQTKTVSYLQQRQRHALQSTLSLQEYLKSLETVATLRLAGVNDLARLAQMSQKTNQFNLMTERLDEQDVRDRTTREHTFILIEVKDRYGNLGIVGYGELGPLPDPVKHGLRIYNLALSCRALGRGVETVLLYGLIQYARNSGASFLQAHWQASIKNQQVEDFYDRHLFTCTHATADAKAYWMGLNESTTLTFPQHITLINHLE